MWECKCGGLFIPNGYNKIDIDERELLVIKGDCKCNKCGKEASYEQTHKVDFNNPYDVEIYNKNEVF